MPKTAPTNGEAKKQAILKAAWTRIKHYGYDKTTVDEIARDAGIAKGTVYIYYESKQDIMLALAEQTNRNLLDELREIADGNLPPEKKVREILTLRVLRIHDIVKKHPHGEDVVGSLKPFIVERLEGFLAEQAGLVEKCLDEGVKNGTFKVRDTKAAAELLTNLFEFLTPPYYRMKSKADIEKFASEVLELAYNGMLRK
jgi:AcrR family transcriptional regulator